MSKKHELIELEKDLEKVLLPELRSDIPIDKIPYYQSFWKTINISNNPYDYILNILKERIKIKTSTLSHITISEKESLTKFLNDIENLNSTNMNDDILYLKSFLLGVSIGSYDTSSLLSRHAMRSIQMVSSNMANGQNGQRKQFIVFDLIAELYAKAIIHSDITYSFKKEDLYEAIHERIVEFLRYCKREDICSLFAVYRKRVKDDDDFATSYYSPSTRKISEILVAITPDEEEDEVLKELNELVQYINNEKQDLDLSKLTKLFKQAMKNKEIENFLSIKIKSL